MKKAYVKPELYFENFELSSNIAVSCGSIIRTIARDVCGIEVDGAGTAFLDGIQNCSHKAPDGTYGICYHNPTDTQSLFNSQ